MRADTCRFALFQPLVPQGVPGTGDDPWDDPPRGALCLKRSHRNEVLLCDVVEACAKWGASNGWVRGCPCGQGREGGGTALWCSRLAHPVTGGPMEGHVVLQEASLGWVCTWHTHTAVMDPLRWHAHAVVTYRSCPDRCPRRVLPGHSVGTGR